MQQDGVYYHKCPIQTVNPRNENLDDTDPRQIGIISRGNGAEQVIAVIPVGI